MFGEGKTREFEGGNRDILPLHGSGRKRKEKGGKGKKKDILLTNERGPLPYYSRNEGKKEREEKTEVSCPLRVEKTGEKGLFAVRGEYTLSKGAHHPLLLLVEGKKERGSRGHSSFRLGVKKRYSLSIHQRKEVRESNFLWRLRGGRVGFRGSKVNLCVVG